jgi:hypothetical protein
MAGVVCTWTMGNDSRVQSEYYGGYPAGYLRRIRALFADKQVLHIFSGKVDLAALPGDTVDIKARLSPIYVDDAQRLELVPLEAYNLVLADPPYRRRALSDHHGKAQCRVARLGASLSGLSHRLRVRAPKVRLCCWSSRMFAPAWKSPIRPVCWITV